MEDLAARIYHRSDGQDHTAYDVSKIQSGDHETDLDFGGSTLYASASDTHAISTALLIVPRLGKSQR